MTYRRRAGKRMTARKKVSRGELVKFYQTARLKEETKKAHRKAERFARVLKVTLVLVAVTGVIVTLVLRSG